MKHYIIHNAAGDILRTGQCTDEQFALPTLPGEFIIEGIARDTHHRIEDGQIVERVPETPPAPGYAEQRRAAYPPWTELADALYWLNQGNDAPMRAYLAQVKAVKERFPKAP